MRLTAKLLGFLNRVFDKDPRRFLGLRLSYAGGMTWQVADGTLTTAVSGGAGAGLSVSLADYTVAGLAGFLAAQPSYSVPYVDPSDLAELSALVLLDGAGDIAASNGDHLYGYTNANWAVLEASADQLGRAEQAINAMPAQMSVASAEGEWLDLHGSYYVVPRRPLEPDGTYRVRIPATVFMPKCNNVAIEVVLTAATGQACRVTDVVLWGNPVPAHNGTINHDGSHFHNASAAPVYGLFDVLTGYDLLGGNTPTDFLATIGDMVEAVRAAGTQLRAVNLQDSSLSDAVAPPADALGPLSISAGLTDVVAAPGDTLGLLSLRMTAFADTVPAADDSADNLQVAFFTLHDGRRRHDGAVLHASGLIVAESLAGVLAGTSSPLLTGQSTALTTESGLPLLP